MKQLSHLHLEVGPAGWVKAFWRREAGDENVVFVRFRPPANKRQRWTPIAMAASKDSRPPWLSSDLIADVPWHRIDVAVTTSDVYRGWLNDGINEKQPSDLDAAFQRHYREAPRVKLARPPRGNLDDAFYRQVAHAYRRAVVEGRPPLKAIAEDSNISRGTVARWVATARERRFLPRGSKGKVTA
jgi:hypothetical protein